MMYIVAGGGRIPNEGNGASCEGGFASVDAALHHIRDLYDDCINTMCVLPDDVIVFTDPCGPCITRGEAEGLSTEEILTKWCERTGVSRDETVYEEMEIDEINQELSHNGYAYAASMYAYLPSDTWEWSGECYIIGPVQLPAQAQGTT
jgi:hypothetical protein